MAAPSLLRSSERHQREARGGPRTLGIPNASERSSFGHERAGPPGVWGVLEFPAAGPARGPLLAPSLTQSHHPQIISNHQAWCSLSLAHLFGPRVWLILNSFPQTCVTCQISVHFQCFGLVADSVQVDQWWVSGVLFYAPRNLWDGIRSVSSNDLCFASSRVGRMPPGPATPAPSASEPESPPFASCAQ